MSTSKISIGLTPEQVTKHLQEVKSVLQLSHINPGDAVNIEYELNLNFDPNTLNQFASILIMAKDKNVTFNLDGVDRATAYLFIEAAHLLNDILNLRSNYLSS
jgi:hypothetical protein